MLVLTRKEGERIVIGEGPKQVVVAVQRVSGGRVRLAFVAPPDVPVHREEVAKRIKAA